MPPRVPQNDHGVSPVVGMVLVLAITALGITGVLVWGLPAINEMKATVEHQAVIAELSEFDADVKELTKTSVSKTAKVWRFNQAKGDFVILSGTERWIVGADAQSTLGYTYNFTAYGLDDKDGRFVLVNNRPAAIPLDVKADLLDAGATVGLQVRVLANPGDGCNTASPLVPGVTIPAASGGVGGTKGFCLFYSSGAGGEVAIKELLLQIQVWRYGATAGDREAAAWFWVTDTGRAQWSLDTANGVREAFVSNGGLVQGSNGRHLLQGDPTLTPPTKQANEWHFFGRLVTINGTASLGGQGRIDVLLSLYGNRELTNNLKATAVKVWTYGRLEGTWDNYFLDKPYKMKRVAETAATAPAGTNYLEYVPDSGPAKVVLHHSVVTATG